MVSFTFLIWKMGQNFVHNAFILLSILKQLWKRVVYYLLHILVVVFVKYIVYFVKQCKQKYSIMISDKKKSKKFSIISFRKQNKATQNKKKLSKTNNKKYTTIAERSKECVCVCVRCGDVFSFLASSWKI